MNIVNEKLLTSERFKLTHVEVKEKLIRLKSDNLISNDQFKKVMNEDLMLKIKHRTYKKCLKQFIFGLITIVIGILANNSSSFSYICIVGGIIISTSSFFGILSNRLTKNQIKYIKQYA